MEQRLAVQVEHREGSVLLHLAGALDGSGAMELAWRLEALAGRHVVVDFSRVQVVEPFGAQVLALQLKRLRAMGVRPDVKGLSWPVALELWLRGGSVAAAEV